MDLRFRGLSSGSGIQGFGDLGVYGFKGLGGFGM